MATRFRFDSGQEVLLAPGTATVDTARVVALGLPHVMNAPKIAAEVAALTNAIRPIEAALAVGERFLYVREASGSYHRGEVIV